jgi:hypothetical protein
VGASLGTWGWARVSEENDKPPFRGMPEVALLGAIGALGFALMVKTVAGNL